MTRAYPVLARNDIVSLSYTDGRPNTSQDNVSFVGRGNTGYISFQPHGDIPSLVDVGAGVYQNVFDCFSMMGYLLDNVENVGGGNVILTMAEAGQITLDIAARIAAGESLTLAAINTVINTPAGVTDSDLNGVVAGSGSTGSVEELVRIASGATYLLPAGATISGAASAFVTPHVPAGAFTAQGDEGHRHLRVFVANGTMRLSMLSGQISKMAASDFAFENPSFTYGTGGTAETIAGVAIPVTHEARAVVVYDAAGNVLS